MPHSASQSDKKIKETVAEQRAVQEEIDRADRQRDGSDGGDGAMQASQRTYPGQCPCAGPVWTPLNPADRPPEQIAHFGSGTPMGRAVQPEEIAPAHVFLAAPVCSSDITGEILPIIGGH